MQKGHKEEGHLYLAQVLVPLSFSVAIPKTSRGCEIDSEKVIKNLFLWIWLGKNGFRWWYGKFKIRSSLPLNGTWVQWMGFGCDVGGGSFSSALVYSIWQEGRKLQEVTQRQKAKERQSAPCSEKK